MALNTQQEQCLGLASDTAIANAFSGLSANFNTIEWLKASNKYRFDPAQEVKSLTATIPFDDDNLVQYIAASVPRNCLDGWVYLGAAIKAIINGDFWLARHLSYYSELRAAFSILGSQGIGVFNTSHVVIDSNGKCNLFPKDPARPHGTHLFAWDAIEHWSKQSKGAKHFGGQITAYGITLNDWLASCPIPHTLLTGYQLLNDWGFDLQTLAHDRNFRNQVSYTPNFSPIEEYQTPSEIYEALNSFWTLSEPVASAFGLLDQYIVKVSLQKRHAVAGGRLSFSQMIDIAVKRLFNDDLDSKRQVVSEFMNSPDQHSIFTLANSKSPLQNKNQYLEVLARAFLLLRLSSASTNKLIISSGINHSNIQSWWQYEGQKRGLWVSGSPPAQITDLWDDVFFALDDFKEWLGSTSEPHRSCINTLQSTEANNLQTLAKFERIALWSLP